MHRRLAQKRPKKKKNASENVRTVLKRARPPGPSLALSFTLALAQNKVGCVLT